MPQGVLPFQLENEHEKTQMTSMAGALPCLELMAAAGVLRSADLHVRVRAGPTRVGPTGNSRWRWSC